jgi:hypothetical protein
VKLHRLRLEPTRGGRRPLELDLLSAPQAVALRPGGTVDEHLTAFEQPLGSRARTDFR